MTMKAASVYPAGGGTYHVYDGDIGKKKRGKNARRLFLNR